MDKIIDLGQHRISQSTKELVVVLNEILRYVLGSDSSLYAHDSVEEIAAELRAAIADLQAGRPINEEDLCFLFAPTGDLQETSIDNDWGQELLTLSARFDKAIGNE